MGSEMASNHANTYTEPDRAWLRERTEELRGKYGDGDGVDWSPEGQAFWELQHDKKLEPDRAERDTISDLIRQVQVLTEDNKRLFENLHGEQAESRRRIAGLQAALRRIRAFAAKRVEETDTVIIAGIDSIAMGALDDR